MLDLWPNTTQTFGSWSIQAAVVPGGGLAGAAISIQVGAACRQLGIHNES